MYCSADSSGPSNYKIIDFGLEAITYVVMTSNEDYEGHYIIF